jgi:hypothetical protein
MEIQNTGGSQLRQGSVGQAAFAKLLSISRSAKDYVLVLLFVKYVSDKYAGQKDALLDVPVAGRSTDIVALKRDK